MWLRQCTHQKLPFRPQSPSFFKTHTTPLLSRSHFSSNNSLHILNSLAANTQISPKPLFSAREVPLAPVHLIFNGSPGSGKRTLAQRVAHEYLLTYVSMGDLLKIEAMTNTVLGGFITKHLSNDPYVDELLPDELVSEVLKRKLVKLRAREKGWVLEGYPKTEVQHEHLQEILAGLGIRVNFNFWLNIHSQFALQRIKERRVHLPSGRMYNNNYNPPKTPGKDIVTGESLVTLDRDQPHRVLRRMQIYSENTEPLLKYLATDSLIDLETSDSDEAFTIVDSFLQKTTMEMNMLNTHIPDRTFSIKPEDEHKLGYTNLSLSEMRLGEAGRDTVEAARMFSKRMASDLENLQAPFTDNPLVGKPETEADADLESKYEDLKQLVHAIKNRENPRLPDWAREHYNFNQQSAPPGPFPNIEESMENLGHQLLNQEKQGRTVCDSDDVIIEMVDPARGPSNDQVQKEKLLLDQGFKLSTLSMTYAELQDLLDSGLSPEILQRAESAFSPSSQSAHSTPSQSATPKKGAPQDKGKAPKKGK